VDWPDSSISRLIPRFKGLFDRDATSTPDSWNESATLNSDFDPVGRAGQR
jgi:hypothetical protein